MNILPVFKPFLIALTGTSVFLKKRRELGLIR